MEKRPRGLKGLGVYDFFTLYLVKSCFEQESKFKSERRLRVTSLDFQRKFALRTNVRSDGFPAEVMANDFLQQPSSRYLSILTVVFFFLR